LQNIKKGKTGGKKESRTETREVERERGEKAAKIKVINTRLNLYETSAPNSTKQKIQMSRGENI